MSLPHDVGSKPAGERLRTLTTGLALAPAAGPDRVRKRATTDPNAPVPASLLDRRHMALGSHSQANARIIPLSLTNITDTSSLPGSHPSHASQPAAAETSISGDVRSAPVDIPIYKASAPQQSTPWPLTGRISSFPFGSFFPENPHSSPDQSTDKRLTPSPDSSQSETEHFTLSPNSRPSMKVEHGKPPPLHMPSSPLSPAAPAQPFPASRQSNARPPSSSQQGRRQPPVLAIPSLPAFHPANYESRNSSPSSSRPISSPHGRHMSEAQRQYQQQQRDLILNYTRNAVRNTGKGPIAQPRSPRLDPLGSPGPITPLNLEGQNDYFAGGPRKGSTSMSKGHERREIVDRMIGLERERTRYPERAGRHSPAVSPAGGPG
ncbi:MAG: hypothetical protein Q9169_005654 [Polycauliona sp. 2 TL-2023]